jgi:hypothetical protein
LEIYGSAKPLNYLENFNLIDIPIHYFISIDDAIISADNIIKQYETLKECHPELAFVKVFKGFSHIDFTYMSHPAMLKEIIKTLNEGVKIVEENAPMADQGMN